MLLRIVVQSQLIISKNVWRRYLVGWLYGEGFDHLIPARVVVISFVTRMANRRSVTHRRVRQTKPTGYIYIYIYTYI